MRLQTQGADEAQWLALETAKTRALQCATARIRVLPFRKLLARFDAEQGWLVSLFQLKPGQLDLADCWAKQADRWAKQAYSRLERLDPDDQDLTVQALINLRAKGSEAVHTVAVPRATRLLQYGDLGVACRYTLVTLLNIACADPIGAKACTEFVNFSSLFRVTASLPAEGVLLFLHHWLSKEWGVVAKDFLACDGWSFLLHLFTASRSALYRDLAAKWMAAASNAADWRNVPWGLQEALVAVPPTEQALTIAVRHWQTAGDSLHVHAAVHWAWDAAKVEGLRRLAVTILAWLASTEHGRRSILRVPELVSMLCEIKVGQAVLAPLVACPKAAAQLVRRMGADARLL